MTQFTKEEKKEIIIKGLEEGLNTESLGRKLGVSRQRVYQLMMLFGVSTPDRRKQNHWKDKDERLKWFNRTVTGRVTLRDKDILIENIEKDLDKFFPKNCPVLGIPLVYGAEKMRGEDSASIDRLDAEKDYTFDNIAIISWRANRIKNDGSFEEHKKLLEWWSKKLDNT